MRGLFLALVLAAGPATAGPNPQLLRSIESRLRPYGVIVDTATLSTRQAAALHLTLSERGRDPDETRRRLRTILLWEKGERR